MALDLRGDEARDLAALSRSTLAGRLAQTGISLVGVAVVVFILTIGSDELCSDQAPCAGDPLTAIATAALFAVMFVGWIQPWAAAIAAALFAMAIWPEMASEPEASQGALALFGYVGVITLLAWLATRERRRPEAAAWRDRHTPHETVPDAMTRIRGPHVVGISVLLLLGGLLIGVGLWQRYDYDRLAKRTVSATVLEHLGGGVITVRADDGSHRIEVLTSEAYPVGSTIRVVIGADGSIYTVAEPHDPTAWLFVGGIFALAGAGLMVRRAETLRRCRRLLRDPQPATRLWISEPSAAIHPADVVPYDHAIGQLRKPQWLRGRRPAETVVRRGVLYGLPVRGEMVAVAADGGKSLIVGRFAAASGTIRFPADEPVEVPVEPKRAVAEGIPTRKQEPEMHRLDAAWVYGVSLFATVALCMICLAWVRGAPPVTIWLVSAAAVGALMAALWWLMLRPVTYWNDGGVAVVDHKGSHTFRWSEVTRIETYFNAVRIYTTDGRRAQATAGKQWKDMEQSDRLVAQLKAAQGRYDPQVLPPPIVLRPEIAWALPAMFIGCTIVVGLLLSR